jgi:threonine/homoserine/homoserine lactone efflux protein
MDLLFLGIAVGFTISLPPGPVAFEVIKRGLSRGFLPAFPLGIGAALADLFYASLVYFGAMKLLDKNPNFRTGIYLIGALLLIGVAIRGFWHIKKGLQMPVSSVDTTTTTLLPRDASKKKKFGYHIFHFVKRVILGFTMAVFNPTGFLFFITLFPPIFAKILNSENRNYAYLFVIGFALGVVILFTLEAMFTSQFKKLLSEKVFRKIAIILNIVLLVCAAYFIVIFIDRIT